MAVTLRQKNGTFEIIKENNQVATCPYRQMLTTQIADKVVTKDSAGIRLAMSNQTCTSDCAKFQMSETDKGKKILLSCGVGTAYDLGDVEQPDEKKTRTLEHYLSK